MDAIVDAMSTKPHLPDPLVGLELLDLPFLPVVLLPHLVPALPEDLSVPLDPIKFLTFCFYLLAQQ